MELKLKVIKAWKDLNFRRFFRKKIEIEEKEEGISLGESAICSEKGTKKRDSLLSLPKDKEDRQRRFNFDLDEDEEVIEVWRKVVEMCEKLQGKFEDSEFPVSEALGLGNLGGRADLSGKRRVELRKKLEEVKLWLRPEQIFADDKDGGHFGLDWEVVRTRKGPGPRVGDIVQGQLGTCWLDAVLGMIAEKGLLKEILVTPRINSGGAYVVRLYEDEGVTEKLVLVDDRFPCDKWRRLCFTKAKRKQIWAPLILKGMAKLRGGYDTLHGGQLTQALEALLGIETAEILVKGEIRERQAMANALWLEMLHHCEEGNFLFAETDAEDVEKLNNMLNASHAYCILKVVEDFGHRLVKLRDPQGITCWMKSFHPYSADWGTRMRQVYKPHLEEPGTFYMEYDEFIKFVYVLTVGFVGKRKKAATTPPPLPHEVY